MPTDEVTEAIKRQLVNCKGCGAVFVREQAPSRQCPACHYDGVEESETPGLQTKRSWYEELP